MKKDGGIHQKLHSKTLPLILCSDGPIMYRVDSELKKRVKLILPSWPSTVLPKPGDPLLLWTNLLFASTFPSYRCFLTSPPSSLTHNFLSPLLPAFLSLLENACLWNNSSSNHHSRSHPRSPSPNLFHSVLSAHPVIFDMQLLFDKIPNPNRHM